MDLIYTDARRVDQGVLAAHALDLSYGASENNFTLTVSAEAAVFEYGAFVYIDGTEYGGIIDGAEISTNGDTVTYFGRTWHGILNSKIILPSAGARHRIANGDAHSVVAELIEDLGLGTLFVASSDASGLSVENYKFHRYCAAYDGILDMLESVHAKLIMRFENRHVVLSCVPASDHSQNPIDGDMARLHVTRTANKVNHLICLGRLLDDSTDDSTDDTPAAASEILLTDRSNGNAYALYVAAGNLTMDAAASGSAAANEVLLTDLSSGQIYSLYVDGGNLTMDAVASGSAAVNEIAIADRSGGNAYALYVVDGKLSMDAPANGSDTREVIHLYANSEGKIGNTPSFAGLDEYAATYDNTNSEDLRADGVKRFKELLATDNAEIDLNENDAISYDVGDIVGATEIRTGISATARVTQKIVRINNGVASVEYKTGG